MLYFIKFISKGRGGGSELESISDHFKMIYSHKLVDKNWASTENIYRLFSKILCSFSSIVCCYQQPNTNETEELTKVNITTFDYYVGLHQNDLINNKIRQEDDKYYEASQDTYEFFIHPIKFCYISSTSWCPPMVYTIPLPSIFIDCTVIITSSAWFWGGGWNSIIIGSEGIHYKSIYIPLSTCMNRNIMGIIFNPPSSVDRPL